MSKKRFNNLSPEPGKISRLSKKEVDDLIIKPVDEAKPIFDYLAEWRSRSMKSSFTFD